MSSSGNGSRRSSTGPPVCINPLCGKRIYRGTWIGDGTPFCDYCAGARVAAALTAPAGAAWLTGWYERLEHALRAAAE